MYLDEILDTKYEVYLVEAPYQWSDEYDNYWSNTNFKLLQTYKTRDEAEAYLETCEAFKDSVQKNYRGTISYKIKPMYLRHKVDTVWVDTKETQAEMDAFVERFFPTKKTAPYTG